MMNYAAGHGALMGIIFNIAMDCKYTTKTIDGKALAAKLLAAIEESKERGEKYDDEHDEYGNRK